MITDYSLILSDYVEGRINKKEYKKRVELLINKKEYKKRVELLDDQGNYSQIKYKNKWRG
jgi:hypothetical protein